MRLQMASPSLVPTTVTLFTASFPANISGWTPDPGREGSAYIPPSISWVSSPSGAAAGALGTYSHDWIAYVIGPLITGIQGGDVLRYSPLPFFAMSSSGQVVGYGARYYSDTAGTALMGTNDSFPDNFQVDGLLDGPITVPAGAQSFRPMLCFFVDYYAYTDDIVITMTRP